MSKFPKIPVHYQFISLDTVPAEIGDNSGQVDIDDFKDESDRETRDRPAGRSVRVSDASGGETFPVIG